MPEVNVTMGVTAEILNLDNLETELSTLIPTKEDVYDIISSALESGVFNVDVKAPQTFQREISNITSQFKAFEENLGVKMDFVIRAVEGMERTVKYVMPRVRPLQGRSDITQVITQISEAKKLLEEEGIEETIERNMEGLIPNIISGTDYIRKILESVQKIIASLGKMRPLEQEKMKNLIRDAMNSVMIILDPSAYEKVGRGRVTPLRLDIYKPLTAVFSALIEKGDVFKPSEAALQKAYMEKIKSLFPDYAKYISREEPREGMFVDIGADIPLGPRAKFVGWELKNVVDAIFSNEDYFKQVERIMARFSFSKTTTQIEKAAKLIKEGDIEKGIREMYAEYEYGGLPSFRLPSTQDVHSLNRQWEQYILTGIRKSFDRLKKALDDKSSEEIDTIISNMRLDKEGRVVSTDSSGNPIIITTPIFFATDIMTGKTERVGGILGPEEAEKKARELVTLPSFEVVKEMVGLDRVDMDKISSSISEEIRKAIPEEDFMRLKSLINDLATGVENVEEMIVDFINRVNKNMQTM